MLSRFSENAAGSHFASFYNSAIRAKMAQKHSLINQKTVSTLNGSNLLSFVKGYFYFCWKGYKGKKCRFVQIVDFER